MNWFKVNDPTSTSLIALCFNSVSPQFHKSPREIRAHSLPLLLDRFRRAGQTIKRSNAYLTSNLNSITLRRIHATTDPNHPSKCTELNAHVGIRGIMHAGRREARGSENCSDFGFLCRRRKYPVFMSTVCLYCSAEVPLDLPCLCSQRHKQVPTAADCFDIYLIRDATSQSDSSPEQQRGFRAGGRPQIKSLPAEN